MTETKAAYKIEFNPADHIRIQEYRNRKTGEITRKKILDTAPRIAWFRAEHPIESGWQLVSEPLTITDDYADFMARVISPEGLIVSTGHRRVWRAKWANFIEKAETQAKGRALEGAGYGCLYALTLEIDEGEDEADIATSGVTEKKTNSKAKVERPAPPEVVKGWLHQKAKQRCGVLGYAPPDGEGAEAQDNGAQSLARYAPPSKEQIGLLAGKIAEALQDTAPQPRWLIYRWLWDTEHGRSDECPPGAIQAMLDWLILDKDDTGDYPLNRLAVQELLAISKQAQKDAGQADIDDLFGKEETA